MTVQRKSTVVKKSFYAWLIVLLGSTVGAAPFSAPGLRPDMTILLERATQGPKEYDAALIEVQAMPAQEAIAASLEALNEAPVAQRADLRKLLINVLCFHKDRLPPEGYERLITALEDPSPSIQQLSCAALPSEKITYELEKLLAVVSDLQASDSKRERAVKRISGWGLCIKHRVDIFINLFRDQNESERMRWFAARGTIRSGGLIHALGELPADDAVGQKVFLWALTNYCGEHDECSAGRSFGKDAHSKIVLLFDKVMKSEDARTRRAAMEALIPVSGTRFFSHVKSSDEYALDPTIRQALEKMAGSDPDETLRTAAASMLDKDFLARQAGIALRSQEAANFGKTE